MGGLDAAWIIKPGQNLIVVSDYPLQPKRSIQPDSSPMAPQDELCKSCISKHQGQQIFPQNPNCHKKRILPF